ncbi:phosphoribosylglycinamide formyltransferase [Natranaerobius trueperi]|uniref:Phosphoribosylglycinamide formyltransferase n=1 Tax=Natranaerobius trueperi TaxID=759412 RepID=A0A226C2R7_9FIRM|nr:phosphoribosylglycinamide formyltransferase [Natranaerobius trueperi]OWZ84739.1 phosphoribosylglycinamide formyltransferase [Natranaerobius trueperi]
MINPQFAVFASGSGTIFQDIIDAYKKGEIPGELSVLITDKPNCLARQRAIREGIATKVFSIKDYGEKEVMDREMVTYLQANQIEYIVLAGYMKILSSYFIRNYQNCIINTHPSLLPSFKGLNAVQKAYDYGVKVTGCTVHFVTEKMDEGPILLQKEVNVLPDDTVESLTEKIKEQERKLIVKALKALLLNQITETRNQRWVMTE